MTYILMIMAVPFLTVTGIYNPPVMQNGRCIAEPGSFAALYCPVPPPAPHHRYGKER
jgi:hypothetical protein